MFSDQDGDEFLKGWSSQLVLRTLEFSAVDRRGDNAAQAVGDLWGRRKKALQFLVSRSPDVTARVLLSPFFCEQTSPALTTQLQDMCQHVWDVDRAFWDEGRAEIPGEVPQEEVTFAATVMRSVNGNDGLLNTEDVLPDQTQTGASPTCDKVKCTASSARHRAQLRLKSAQRVTQLAPPSDVIAQRSGHATLSLRARAPPPSMAEKAFLMRDLPSISLTNAWSGDFASSSSSMQWQTHSGVNLATCFAPPCRVRTLQEQLQAEAMAADRNSETIPALDEEARIIEEPQWAREERQERERQEREQVAAIGSDHESESHKPHAEERTAHVSESARAERAATDQEPIRVERPPPEKTVLGEDEELVISGGQFIVRKKNKPRKQKEEKPMPEVVHPGVSHHDRKRPRDTGDAAGKKHTGTTKHTRPDDTLDSVKTSVVSVAQAPQLTRDEIVSRLEAWGISGALREALSIGLEFNAVPLAASETSEAASGPVDKEEGDDLKDTN